MGVTVRNHQFAHLAFLTLLSLQSTHSTTLKDIFTSDSILSRVPRDSKYLNRYDSRTDENDKTLKPEESHEVSENAAASVGKRCSRCDNYYDRDRYPYDRPRYYDDRRREYDRYDDRYNDRDRYEKDHYTSGRDRYYDSYDRYERYPSRSGGYYNRNDNRYGDRYSDRYNDNDRYYDPYGRYDRYDRYDKYDRYDRYSDRGVGYDNRGYDYREGYRPLDETYRGSSGFDSTGRGYYFANGRPDYGTSGYGYGNNNRYASGWDYGGTGGGRDDYYRDRGYGGGNRYRDPYDGGYRSTSYLYGRSSSTTIKPPNSDSNSNTQSPQDNSG